MSLNVDKKVYRFIAHDVNVLSNMTIQSDTEHIPSFAVWMWRRIVPACT
jgi:hypothetical protein